MKKPVNNLAASIFSNQEEAIEVNHQNLAPLRNESRIVALDTILPHANNRQLNQDKIIDLANSIEMNGILQPPVVLDMQNGTYVLLAGHHRMEACKLLHMSELRCIVKQGLDRDDAELILIDTNLLNTPLSPYEKMMAIGRKEEILKEKKTKGTMRNIIAENLSLEPTQVGTYLKIYKRASDEVKESLKQGTITLERASQLTSLDAKTQVKDVQAEPISKELNELIEYKTLLKKYYAMINKVATLLESNPSVSSKPELTEELLPASLDLKDLISRKLELVESQIMSVTDINA